MKKLIVPNQVIHCNLDDKPKFETLGSIDPISGNFNIRRIADILQPGRVYEVRVALFDELLEIAAKQEAVGAQTCVRLPEEREVLSFKNARGDFNAQA